MNFMLINIYWPTLSFSHGCKKPSSQSQNCKKAYWIFRRFSGKWTGQPHAQLYLPASLSPDPFHISAFPSWICVLLLPARIRLGNSGPCSVPHLSWAFPEQGRTAGSLLFAVVEILVVSVDFVCQNMTGVVSLAPVEVFNHFLELGRFIVGIKRTVFQSRPAVCDTDIQLHAKLHGFVGFLKKLYGM